MKGVRAAVMPQDADYYRARAIEQRGLAVDADSAGVASLHRDLARRYDRLAEQCDGIARQFELLAEQASQSINNRTP